MHCHHLNNGNTTAYVTPVPLDWNFPLRKTEYSVFGRRTNSYDYLQNVMTRVRGNFKFNKHGIDGMSSRSHPRGTVWFSRIQLNAKMYYAISTNAYDHSRNPHSTARSPQTMFSRLRRNAGPSLKPFFQIQPSRRSSISPRAPLN